MINWHLGDSFDPVYTEDLNFEVKEGRTKYSIFSGYDPAAKTISVRREYRIHKRMFFETYASRLEKLFEKVKKNDLAAIYLEKI